MVSVFALWKTETLTLLLFQQAAVVSKNAACSMEASAALPRYHVSQILSHT